MCMKSRRGRVLGNSHLKDWEGDWKMTLKGIFLRWFVRMWGGETDWESYGKVGFGLSRVSPPTSLSRISFSINYLNKMYFDTAYEWLIKLSKDFKYSKTCLKRNAIIPVFFSHFHRFPFYKGLCFNKTKYKKYDRLGLQWRNNLK